MKERIEELASEFTMQMFTNGAGTIAERLVLVNASKLDLGGWSQEPFRQHVIDLLMTALETKRKR